MALLRINQDANYSSIHSTSTIMSLGDNKQLFNAICQL